ncbi:hypothetical protein MyChFU_17980 [Mycobacterium intracellulare subsp. chimaera]
MTCVKVIVDTDRAAIDSGIHRHTFEFTWITHPTGAKPPIIDLTVNRTRPSIFAEDGRRKAGRHRHCDVVPSWEYREVK